MRGPDGSRSRSTSWSGAMVGVSVFTPVANLPGAALPFRCGPSLQLYCTFRIVGSSGRSEANRSRNEEPTKLLNCLPMGKAPS